MSYPTVGTEGTKQYSVHTHMAYVCQSYSIQSFMVTLYAVGYLTALFAVHKQKNKELLNLNRQLIQE